MSSFIKGNKIWHRIEKKLLVSDFSCEDVGLLGAFALDSTVCFMLDMKISAACAKIIFFSDADGKRKEFEMTANEEGGFYAELYNSQFTHATGETP